MLRQDPQDAAARQMVGRSFMQQKMWKEAIAAFTLAGTLAMTDHLIGANLQARNLRAALDAGEPVRLARSLAMEAICASVSALLTTCE